MANRLAPSPDAADPQQFLPLHVQNSPLAYVEFDSAQRMRRWSKRAEELFGYTAEEMIGRRLISTGLIHAEERERVSLEVEQWLNGNHPHEVVYNRNVAKNGEVLHCKWYSSRILDEHGEMVSIAALVHNVTEQRETEETLRKSKERWHSLVEYHPDGIMVMQNDEIVYANQKALRILRADDKKQVLGRSILHFAPPEQHEKMYEQKQVALLDDFHSPIRYRVRRLDGTEGFVEVSSRTITYEGQQAVQSVVREVTGPTRREERLQEQNVVLTQLAQCQTSGGHDLRSTLQRITEAAAYHLDARVAEVWRFSDDRTTLRCLSRHPSTSPQCAAHDELSADAYADYLDHVRSKRIFTAPEAQSDEPLHEFRSELEEHGITSVLTAPIRQGDEMTGLLRLLYSGMPRSWVPDEQYFARSVADITALAFEMSQRRQTEAALRQNRQQYESVVENVQEVIFQTDQKGRWTFLSEAWTEVTGYSVSASLGQHVSELFFEEDRTSILEKIRSIIQEEENNHHHLRLRFHDKTGRTRWAEARFRALRDDDQRLVGSVGTLLDITERQEAEEALRASEQKYRSLTATAPNAIIVADADTGCILEANRQASKLWKRPIDQLVGMNQPQLHPSEQADHHRHLFKEDVEHGQGTRRGVLIERSDGVHVPVEISYNVTELDERRIMQLIFRDVTKQKERERALVSAKEEAEKLNRLKSNFLANMSHEIRTPLTSIIGFGDVLASEVDVEKKELVDMIRQSGRRLMETLNSVLHLSQLESGNLELHFETVDLAEIAREAAAPFRAQTNQKDLTLKIEADHPVQARLDQGAIHRVATNLISNAVKFTERGGTVTVRTGVTHAATVQQVWMEVEDTGIGISEDFQEKLFEEFKQESSGLSRDHEGSGLGLAITQRLTRRMGGHVSVDSEKGEGSRFRVTFPHADPASAATNGEK